jgi:invasion protein IalB
MKKLHQLSAALLVASATVAAESRSNLPSLSFSHKDWELVCDNTRTCRAAGYHAEDDGPNASILLTRAAGPNQPVTVQLQLADDEGHPAPDQLAMTIDGRALGPVRIDTKSNTGNLSRTQVDALLPALLKDGRIAWMAKQTTWTISTAGANAVLLKMDEFQGRLGTPGALARKGSRPEENVLPPLAAPEIKAAPLTRATQPVALPAAQMRDLMAALRKTVKDGSCDLLDTKPDEAGEPDVVRLTSDKLLVSHACWMAAYNSGDGYWVVDATPPYSAVLVTTSATDYADGVISSAQKGRGIADCVGTATWTWDGKSFVQTSATTTGMCHKIAAGGAWDLPTLVTRVLPAR